MSDLDLPTRWMLVMMTGLCAFWGLCGFMTSSGFWWNAMELAAVVPFWLFGWGMGHYHDACKKQLERRPYRD